MKAGHTAGRGTIFLVSFINWAQQKLQNDVCNEDQAWDFMQSDQKLCYL